MTIVPFCHLFGEQLQFFICNFFFCLDSVVKGVGVVAVLRLVNHACALAKLSLLVCYVLLAMTLLAILGWQLRRNPSITFPWEPQLFVLSSFCFRSPPCFFN